LQTTLFRSTHELVTFLLWMKCIKSLSNHIITIVIPVKL
jgi:hypothetical protein